MPTIIDIAREASVSTAAVSLVLNDPDTRRVGAAKRKEILRVARRIGYTPNLLAKGLVKRSTGILGLVVPMRDPIFFNYFIAEVLAGIQSCLMERGYHLMVYSHMARTGKITRSQVVQSRFVDGLIFFNTRLCTAADMAATIEELAEAGIRFVMVNSYYGHDPIHYVGADDRAIGHLAGQYLGAKGHRRVALLGGARSSPLATPIHDGFRAGLEGAGVRYDRGLTAFGEYRSDGVHAAIDGWLTRKHPPTAVFCADDQMVPDIYEALESRMLRVPGDMAVLGRGDLMFTGHLSPKLTTIRVPTFEMGRRAAELLIDSLEHNTPAQRILLPGTLIERESV